MLDGYQNRKQEYRSKQDWRGRFPPKWAGVLTSLFSGGSAKRRLAKMHLYF
jgi:hypothetical protein